MAQEEENWDPGGWKHLLLPHDRTLARRPRKGISALQHYNVGAYFKFWGSVSMACGARTFKPLQHMDGVSPAWPIDYDTLAPVLTNRAERPRNQVHGQQGADPTEARGGPTSPTDRSLTPGATDIVQGLGTVVGSPFTAVLGLRDGCILCNTCNSFPCKLHAKSEADVCCVRPALERPNVTLWTNAFATRLMTDASGRRIEAVEVQRNGETVRVEASLFIVSCGAVNSAALMLRSANAAHPNGLANSSGLVGKRYMAHLATMMEGFHPFRTQRDGVPEDGGHQRLLFSMTDERTIPLGQIHKVSQGRTQTR